jgi:Predicted membrane protein (DUF2306)
MNSISAKRVAKTVLYLPLIFLILLISVYPLQFFLLDGKVGILRMKSDALLVDWIWKTFFYMHITFGGLALLVGWLQFNKRLREQYLAVHRAIGKIYLFSVWLSALGVGYIGFFAEGGVIAFLGFMTGGLIWSYTTTQGYLTIRKGKVNDHQRFMIYSYAACMGAVTLRIWLPLLTSTTNDFILSYQIVSWLAWAPNLVVAYFIIINIENAHTNNNSISL